MEVAPQKRINSQRPKKSIAHRGSMNRFGSVGGAEQVSGLVIYIHRTEYLVEPLPVQVIGIRQIGAWHHRHTLGCDYQAIGIRIRQRLDQSGIYKSEDRQAGAHAERERQNGCGSEAWRLAQLP